MQEIWKDVETHRGLYQVSNKGRVFSIRNKKFLSLWKDKDSYLRCNLKKNSVVRQISIHRLVAENFIPNPENKPQVNHKDGNRQNNDVKNLEWVTCLENQRHKHDVLGYRIPEERIKKMQEGAKKYANLPEIKKKRADIMRKNFSKRIIDITTGIIYESQRSAAIKTNCSQGEISLVCAGTKQGTKGHIFRFYPEEPTVSEMEIVEQEPETQE